MKSPDIRSGKIPQKDGCMDNVSIIWLTKKEVQMYGIIKIQVVLNEIHLMLPCIHYKY